MGIGAYTSAILTTKLGLNFWLTIPVAMIIGEIVSSKLNNAKVSAMITRFKAEEAKKKAELEKQKMAQNIQPIDNKK